MVTLTRLLVISTVVSSCSLSDRSVVMRLSESDSLDSILLRSVGESEKKAISDAEAKAETNNSKPASTIATRADVVGGVIVVVLKIFAPKRHKYTSESNNRIFS